MARTTMFSRSRKPKTYLLLHGDVEWKYQGGWRKGYPHGTGKATSPLGECYDGEWCDGVRHGKGKYTWSDGNYYDGQWCNGDFQGRGLYYWAETKNVYDGQWVEGVRHGRGARHAAGRRRAGRPCAREGLRHRASLACCPTTDDIRRRTLRPTHRTLRGRARS